MRSKLDAIFLEHLANGGIVLAADMGNFPESRKNPNFVDVGNRESMVGNLAQGFTSMGASVFIYDVAGFVLNKNIHSLIFGVEGITVFSYGSGFSYCKCGDGHYPFRDLDIAEALGFNCVCPLPDTLSNYVLPKNYIRLYDVPKHDAAFGYGLKSSGAVAFNLVKRGFPVDYQEGLSRENRGIGTWVLDHYPTEPHVGGGSFGCNYGRNITLESPEEVMHTYFPFSVLNKMVESL